MALVMSALCCALATPVCALEPLYGEDVPEIDFRDPSPPVQPVQSATTTDDASGEGSKSKMAGDHSSAPYARPSANSYIYVAHWDALDRDQDGYSLKSPSSTIEFGLVWSALEYMSLGLSRAESRVNADYDPVTSFNLSNKITVERIVSTDRELDSVEAMLFIFGRSASTPFIGWRRSRAEASATIEDTVTVSQLFGGPVVSVDVYTYKLSDQRYYGTVWTAGYEYALSNRFAVSAQAFHSIVDESNARWVVVNADLGATDMLRFNIGLSRSNETGDKSFGLGLKFLF